MYVFQLKFRKVMDVKREKELDERRKNEKLEISEDHPIRKLLARMRERHGSRIMPSSYSNDIERVRLQILFSCRDLHTYIFIFQGTRYDHGMSRTTSTQSIMTTTIDETNPNVLQQQQAGSRTPLFSRRRSPMMRGKTMEDDGRDDRGHGLRSNRADGNGGLRASFGDRNGRSSAMSGYGDPQVC